MGNCRLFLPDCPAGMFHPPRFSETGRETGYHPCREIRLFSQHAFPVPRRVRCFKTPSAAALVSMLLVGVLVIGFPFLVRNVLGLSAEHYGAAESALGASAILGSIIIGVVAAKMKVKHMPFIIAAAGFCFFPAGLAFLMPLSAFARFWCFWSSSAYARWSAVCFQSMQSRLSSREHGTPNRQGHVLRIYDFPVRPTVWSDDLRHPV